MALFSNLFLAILAYFALPLGATRAAESKPTVLFIHGSWHVPAHFQLIRDVFEDAGHNTACPRLPSVGHLPPIGLTEDAQRIRQEVSQLVEVEEKEIIVVAHSYGGEVATEALDREFALSARQAAGKKGGVLRLVFMAALLLEKDQALLDLFGGALPSYIAIRDDGSTFVTDPVYRFYNDLPRDEAEYYVSLLEDVPSSTQNTPITQEAYRYHPTTYIHTLLDNALPYDTQVQLVKNVTDRGVQMDVETVESSHSPYISMPGRILEIVQKYT
ncbi:alpha beta-hydrolase [Xylariomycetidae sp. FL0641]|nr:alpha beta-hydrolase [Xylariomycetidae sp. FL0641]